MHVKSIILVALVIATLAMARGIISRAEEDQEEEEEDANNEKTTQLEGESAMDPVIGLTPTSQRECVLAVNAPMDHTSANTNSPDEPLGLDKMDGSRRINIGRRVNLDRIRNELMHRASSLTNSNIWQILENFDFLRPLSENRERLASILSSFINSLIPPQMQYVDNTLRLMAIKNTMDDLVAKIFPNLHMLQHPTKDKSKAYMHQDVD